MCIDQTVFGNVNMVEVSRMKQGKFNYVLHLWVSEKGIFADFIAEQLSISEDMFRNCLSSILDKLEFRNLA